MNKLEDKNINPEFGVDSRYKSMSEAASEATILMKARLKRMKNLSKNDIVRAQLMQLKLHYMTIFNKTMLNPFFSGFKRKLDIYSKPYLKTDLAL
jgi:hypothetical protein